MSPPLPRAHGAPGNESAGFALPLDTALDAHRAQAVIYARLGGAGRLAIAFELTETVRQIALAGIRQRHPDYTDREVWAAWARLTLGDALCREVWPDRALVAP
jgi:hypothetical protein